jgi:hypothetical protein
VPLILTVAFGDQGTCYLPGIIGLTNLLTVPAFAALLIDLTTVWACALELVAPNVLLMFIT